VPVVVVAALAAGGWFVFHKSPETISAAPGRYNAAQRSHTIVVPDVRAQTLVVAKSTLESAGLAWVVVGKVKGYHANLVVAQTPAPGTTLIDTGAPLVSVRLRKSGSQVGTPQQRSAVAGTQVEVRGAATSGVAAASTHATRTTTPATTTTAKPPAATTTTTAKPAPKHATAAKPPAPVHHTTTAAAPPTTTAAKPAATTTAAKPATTTAPKPATTTAAKPAATTTTAAPKPAAVAARPARGKVPFSDRPPAFLLPRNAHRERAGELPLPVRADRLLRFVRAHKKPTNAVVKHWLVQHAWITAGARFGWWHGAQALQTAIAADRLVEAEWGIGYRSEAVAKAALAYVHAHEVKR
jgi:hypothetical protein